jgi:hypothetical protein
MPHVAHPSSSAREDFTVPERDYTAAPGVLLDILIEAVAQFAQSTRFDAAYDLRKERSG